MIPIKAWPSGEGALLHLAGVTTGLLSQRICDDSAQRFVLHYLSILKTMFVVNIFSFLWLRVSRENAFLVFWAFSWGLRRTYLARDFAWRCLAP